MKKKAYILCYTIRTTRDNGLVIDRDFFNVFSDEGSGKKNLRAAKAHLKRLKKAHDNNPELYTWNIAEIIETSEHYI